MRLSSLVQDFPEDGDFDIFPNSPDASSGSFILPLEPDIVLHSPKTPTFPGDIPVLLYDDAYTRDSFIFNSPNSAAYEAMGRFDSGVLHDAEADVSIERLTMFEERLPAEHVNSPPFCIAEDSITASKENGFGEASVSYNLDRPKDLSVTDIDALDNEGNTSDWYLGHPLPLGPPRDTGIGQPPLRYDISDATKLGPSSITDWYRPEINSSIVSNRASTAVEPPPSSVGDSGRDSDSLLPKSEDTPRSRASKTESWISSSDWDYQQYQDFISQQKSTSRPTDAPVHRQASTQYQTAELYPSQSNRRNRTLLPLDNSQTAQRVQLSSKPLESPREDIDSSWLQPFTVQLLIDQEGFRDAEPSFNFSGISQIRRYDASNSSESIKLMAQFRPSSRQTFNFHYAPFEGPPVLRRVVVNGDDALDYVSRQAHLSLRSNGVYIVQGHELAPLEHGSEPSRLYWQFEYLVDDRRFDLSRARKSLEGEKTMTPLTFSCSPNLLLPRQGKKVNIMHIFKKGVSQKLVAEKLQPPGTVPVVTQHEHVGRDDGQVQPCHRRTRSHGLRNDDTQPRAVSDHIYLGRSHEASDTIECHGRHRRVSSADQHQPSSSGTTVHYQNVTGVNKTPPHKPSRHIIPPTQLAYLLDSSSKENGPPSPEPSWSRIGARPMSARSSRGFVGLSPRPKHMLKQGTL